MQRVLICIALAALLGAGCKGKGKTKDSPETVKALSDCEVALKDKQTRITTLERQVAELEGQGGVVTVNIEGEAMSISGKVGGGGGGGGSHGTATDVKLYEAFVAALRASRGSIQKCYQSALKNNATLQARPVTLDIQVAYKSSGQVAAASFNPRVDRAFDSCMSAVAKRWTLPAMPAAVTFNYKQTLTPE